MVKIGNIDRFIFAKTQRGCFTSTHYVGHIFSTVVIMRKVLNAEQKCQQLTLWLHMTVNFCLNVFLLGITCCSR